VSRIDALIDDIEQGRPVDLERTSRLLALDMAREGERFAEEVTTLFATAESATK